MRTKTNLQLNFTYCVRPSRFNINDVMDCIHTINKSKLMVLNIEIPAGRGFMEQLEPHYNIDDNGNDLAVWSKTFYVYCWDGGADDLQATITFYNDWSYEPDYDPILDGLHFPPLQQFAWGQLIPFCTAQSGTLPTAHITMQDGTEVDAELYSWDELADFNNDFSADFSRFYREGAFAFLDTRPYP
jgi:hypothetical protein